MNKTIIGLLTIIWIITIFSFSLEPAEVSRQKSQRIRVQVNKVIAQNTVIAHKSPIQLKNVHIRKLAHVMEYTVLGVLLTLLFIGAVKQKAAVVLTVGTVVACIDESIQHFVPGRGPRFTDVLLDALGVLIGICCVRFYLAMSKKVRREEG